MTRRRATTPADPKRPTGNPNITTGGRAPGTRGVGGGVRIKDGIPPEYTDDLPPPDGDDGGGKTPKPRKPRPVVPVRADVFQRKKTPLRVTYGPTRCRGGHVTYAKRLPNTGAATSGRKLVVYDLEYGPGAGISGITVDGRTLTALGLAAGADYNLYLGDGAASIADDPIMLAHQPGWAAAWAAALANEPRAAEVVRLVVLFKRPTTTIPDVDVNAIEYDSAGIKVFDPAQDPTLTVRYARSSNPRLAIADMETDSRYGGNFPNEVVYGAPNFLEAVNDCDENLGAGRKRYTIGLSIDETQDFDQVIDYMRGHAALCYAYNNGYRQWWVAKDRPASGITFANATGAKNIVQVSPLEYKGSASIPTRVVVKFTNAAAGYKEDFAESKHPLLDSGGVELVEWELEYWGILTYDQAKRIADLTRKDHSIEKSGSIRVKAEGLRCLPGSRVTLTNVVQWNVGASDWKVLKTSPTARRSTWDLDVEPWDSAIYNDALQTTTSYVPPASPSPYDAPDAPKSPSGAAALTIGDGLAEMADGTYAVSWSDVAWPYAIQYRATVDTGSGETTVYEGLDRTVRIDGALLPIVRIYAVLKASGIASVPLLGPIAALAPPEVVDFSANYDVEPSYLHFTQPRARIAALYGAGFWSHTNLVSFVASRVNDGTTAAPAFADPGGNTTLPQIQWAASPAGPFTTVSQNPVRSYKELGGGITRHTRAWSDAGNRRVWALYWPGSDSRLVFDSGEGQQKAFRELCLYVDAADNVMEVQLSELGALVPVRGFRLYSVGVGNTRQLAMPEIPVAAIPTPAAPLNVEFLTTRNPGTWDTPGGGGMVFIVTSVRYDGSESEGTRYSSFSTGSPAGATYLETAALFAIGSTTIPEGRALYVNNSANSTSTLVRFEGTTDAALELIGGLTYYRIAADGLGALRIRNANAGRDDLTITSTGGVQLATSPAIADASNQVATTFHVRAQRKPLFFQSGDQGNVGSGEDDLLDPANVGKLIAAGELVSDGDMIEIIATGTWGSVAGSKAIRIRLVEGANNRIVADTANLVFDASTGGTWRIHVHVWRTGAATYESVAWITLSPPPVSGGTPASCVYSSGPAAITWSNAVRIRITGTGTVNNEIVLKTAAGWRSAGV